MPEFGSKGWLGGFVYKGVDIGAHCWVEVVGLKKMHKNQQIYNEFKAHCYWVRDIPKVSRCIVISQYDTAMY